MFLKEKFEKGAIVQLKDAHYIDVKNGCLYPEGTALHIKDGKIHFMGPETSAPPADYTIDMQGKYILPGMINTHAHIHVIMPGVLVTMKEMKYTQNFVDQQIEKGLADCLKYGTIIVRDALSDKLNELKGLQKKIINGEILGPRIYNSVHIAPLGGTYAPKYSFIQRGIMKAFNHSPVDYSSDGVGIIAVSPDAKENELKKAVDIALKRGADYIKFCDQEEKMLTYKKGALNFDTKQLKTLVKHCNTHKRRTNIHHISLMAFRKSLQSGVSTLAHLPLDKEFSSGDIDLLRNSNTMIEPTLTVAYYYCWPFKGNAFHLHENMKEVSKLQTQTYNDIANKYWLPELQDITLSHFEKARNQRFKMMGFMDMSKVYKLMGGYISNGLRNMQLLLENGFMDKIAFGNDSGASQCSPATRDAEIDMFRLCAKKVGFNDTQISTALIQMFTMNAAKSLGIEKDYGSLEESKNADLAVYPKNPLKNSALLKDEVDALIMDSRFFINKQDDKIKKLCH